MGVATVFRGLHSARGGQKRYFPALFQAKVIPGGPDGPDLAAVEPGARIMVTGPA